MGKIPSTGAAPTRRPDGQPYTTHAHSTNPYSYPEATTVPADRSYSQPPRRNCTVVATGTNFNSHHSQPPSTGLNQPQFYIHNGSRFRYKPAAQATHLTANHPRQPPSAGFTRPVDSTLQQPSYSRTAAIPDARPVSCSSKHPSVEFAQQIPRHDGKQSYYPCEPAIRSQGDATGQNWKSQTFESNRRDQPRGQSPGRERPAPVKTVNPTSSQFPTKCAVAMEHVPEDSAKRAKEYESSLFMRNDPSAPPSLPLEHTPISDLQSSLGDSLDQYLYHAYSSLPRQYTSRGEEPLGQFAPEPPKRFSPTASRESPPSSYTHSPSQYQKRSPEPDVLNTSPLYKGSDAEKEEKAESKAATKTPLSKSLRGIQLESPGEHFIRGGIETKSDERLYKGVLNERLASRRNQDPRTEPKYVRRPNMETHRLGATRKHANEGAAHAF
ncbi:hypothetical protein FRC11_010227 [Ceratobasidium sp. 423]|nr:hypothetical protein FRC11_010227 [Ceratobasidium sp. 423]